MPDAILSRSEFLEYMGVLRDDIKSVQMRLDQLNGRTREVEARVAVLQDRAMGARASGRNWGLSAGAIGSALAAGLSYLLGGQK